MIQPSNFHADGDRVDPDALDSWRRDEPDYFQVAIDAIREAAAKDHELCDHSEPPDKEESEEGRSARLLKESERLAHENEHIFELLEQTRELRSQLEDEKRRRLFWSHRAHELLAALRQRGSKIEEHKDGVQKS